MIRQLKDRRLRYHVVVSGMERGVKPAAAAFHANPKTLHNRLRRFKRCSPKEL
ncbi:MAG: hypothetical protein ONB30_13010 [candidate division KSB1 bacterium]|nr:hypothetical protein [candidate division KSB1 bacterium]